MQNLFYDIGVRNDLLQKFFAAAKIEPITVMIRCVGLGELSQNT